MTGTKKDKKKEIAIKMIIVLKFNSYINTAKREWEKKQQNILCREFVPCLGLVC